MNPDIDLIDVIAAETRPDAVLHLAVAHATIADLEAHDVRRGGVWRVLPTSWRRYDRPWAGLDDPGDARLLGTVYVLHSFPSPYEAVLHRLTVTPTGAALGWTPEQIADDALASVDMRLRDCPRSEGLLERPPLVRV